MSRLSLLDLESSYASLVSQVAPGLCGVGGPLGVGSATQELPSQGGRSGRPGVTGWTSAPAADRAAESASARRAAETAC